jgi:hypothetical protein
VSRAATLPLAGVVAVLALIAGGCANREAGDGASNNAAGGELLAPRPVDTGTGFAMARAFYPLAVGNRWDYRVRWRSTLVTDAGSQPRGSGEYSFRVEITGTTNLGRDYFVQEVSGPGSDPLSRYTLMRKDRSGLYQYYQVVGYLHDANAAPGWLARAPGAHADRAIAIRGTAPGNARGADLGELTLLRFPLFVGARWTEDEADGYVLTVEGREPIQTPLGVMPAWRIRATSASFGPAYRVTLWFGSAGELRERFHNVTNAIDTTGRVVGHVVTDGEMTLAGVHLVPEGSSASGK